MKEEWINKKDTLQDFLFKLPEAQKTVVEAFVESTKVKGPQGMRYDLKWIYECILFRIKSQKAYKHFYQKKSLPLPSVITIRRYLEKMESAFGFDIKLFNCMKLKGLGLDASQRRGIFIKKKIIYN